MRTVWLVVLALLGGAVPAQQPWSLPVVPLTSPASARSGQPQLSVSPRGVILSWVETDKDTARLMFCERTVSGWSAARQVASGANWFVNWADVPSVVRLADGTLVGHWLQKSGADTYAYDVRLAYSRDNGKTWVDSFTPHHDGTKTEHGFASLFQLPGAGLGAVWLDGRNMTGGHDAPAGHDAGAMSLRFAAFSREWKQTADSALDLRVCECCPTAAAITAEGPIVAYRDRSPEEVRDIYVARLVKGRWTEPAPVFGDGWKFNACPVNGPSLSARGRTVALAWFQAKDDKPKAFVSFSSDAGRTFGSPIRLDDEGTLGRVDVDLLPDGSAAAAYIDVTANRAEFRVRRIDASGARSAPITIAPLAANRSSGYPRMAHNADELLFAWVDREGGDSVVRTASARLPR
jgi:hypothetical protein